MNCFSREIYLKGGQVIMFSLLDMCTIGSAIVGFISLMIYIVDKRK